MVQHGSCAARDGLGVLLLGRPGSGKSDLVLRLLGKGWRLVADDQVLLRVEEDRLLAAAPPALRGMLEVRGVGLLTNLDMVDEAPVALAVDCVPRDSVPRLPEPRHFTSLGKDVPRLSLCAFDASAAEKVDIALRAVEARLGCRAGAFEAV